MATFRGVIIFGTDSTYVAPSGVERPRSVAWSFRCFITAADLSAASAVLSNVVDQLRAVMHQAYCCKRFTVSDVLVYRDILATDTADGTRPGLKTNADGWFAAEPEWVSLLDLQAAPGQGGGRHFVHGLARAGPSQPDGWPIEHIWVDSGAFVTLATYLKNNTVLYRKTATAHFAAGVFAWVSFDQRGLDVRKVGGPFVNSPLRFHRRDRDIHPDSP